MGKETNVIVSMASGIFCFFTAKKARGFRFGLSLAGDA